MMNIEKLIGQAYGDGDRNDDDFAVALLEKAMVAYCPCSGFGAPNFIRWTYAPRWKVYAEGMDRLEKFQKGE
jgi:aspartate aminotransferase